MNKKGVRVAKYGKELDFYPSNPGSTPARLSTTKKKRHQKPPSVPFMPSSRKAHLKISKKASKIGAS